MTRWANSTLWLDFNGNRTVTLIYADSAANTVLSALQAMSRAGEQSIWGSPLAFPGNAPVAGAYQSVADRAAFVFTCADATLTTILLPAPDSSIFLSDGATVDITSPPVVAFVAAALTTCQNAAGSAVTALVAAYRLPRARTPVGG